MTDKVVSFRSFRGSPWDFLSTGYRRSFAVPVEKIVETCGLPEDAAGTAAWLRMTFGKDGSVRFGSVDQWVSFCRALWWGDARLAHDMFRCTSAGRRRGRMSKSGGQRSRGWSSVAFRVAMLGNQYKFGQNVDLTRRLLETKGRRLVFASHNKSWGSGRGAGGTRESGAGGGRNRLGAALGVVRAMLRWELEGRGAGAPLTMATQSPGATPRVLGKRRKRKGRQGKGRRRFLR